MKSFHEFLKNKRNILETHDSDESKRLDDKSETDDLKLVRSIRTPRGLRKKTKSSSGYDSLTGEIYKKSNDEFIVKFYLRRGAFFGDLKYIGKSHDYHTDNLQDAVDKATQKVENYFK